MATLNGKAVLFGGSDPDNHPFGDTWTFDGTSWTQVPGTGPSARRRAAMTAMGGKLVLFGGGTVDAAGTTETYLADTWTFDGTIWTQVPSSGPSGREGHAMANLP